MVLSNGRALPFSTCVVCTGSSYTSPIKPDVVSAYAQTTASSIMGAGEQWPRPGFRIIALVFGTPQPRKGQWGVCLGGGQHPRHKPLDAVVAQWTLCRRAGHGSFLAMQIVTRRWNGDAHRFRTHACRMRVCVWL